MYKSVLGWPPSAKTRDNAGPRAPFLSLAQSHRLHGNPCNQSATSVCRGGHRYSDDNSHNRHSSASFRLPTVLTNQRLVTREAEEKDRRDPSNSGANVDLGHH